MFSFVLSTGWPFRQMICNIRNHYIFEQQRSIWIYGINICYYVQERRFRASYLNRRRLDSHKTVQVSRLISLSHSEEYYPSKVYLSSPLTFHRFPAGRKSCGLSSECWLICRSPLHSAPPVLLSRYI